MEENNLICGICQLVIQHPTSIFSNQNGGCLHTFCKDCIREWIQRSASCPMCRAPVSTCVPNKIALEMLAGQQVKCKRFSEGCIFYGYLGSGLNEFQARHEPLCGYAKVECVGCKALILKKDLRSHEIQCKKIKCPFFQFGCRRLFSADELPNHINSSDRRHLIMVLNHEEVRPFNLCLSFV